MDRFFDCGWVGCLVFDAKTDRVIVINLIFLLWL